MSETLSCSGLQELASEAQEIFASLKRGALHDVILPEGFKSSVGLLQFAVSLRKTAEALNQPVKIHATDPALLAIAGVIVKSGVQAFFMQRLDLGLMA